MLVEQWLPIQGYEGRYEISNLGRVKSLGRFRNGKKGSKVPVIEKIMSISFKKETTRTKPYAEIRLRDGSSRDLPCKSFLVHRLVANAFIKPLDSTLQVDHIDGCHSNNVVTNLRVLTVKEHCKIHPCMIDKDRFKQMQQKGTIASREQRLKKMEMLN